MHSFDKIAEMLDMINSESELSYRNVITTVTDNASNFVNAPKSSDVTVVVMT